MTRPTARSGSDCSLESRIVEDFISKPIRPQTWLGNRSDDVPKISIVIPSYNQGRYLERTLRSVLNQTYPNLELIVVDGGSTDGSAVIIARYARYLSYWDSTRDAGQSDALNRGFSRATGDIFGWMNSDDLYLPNAFAHAVNAFKAAPHARIVVGDWWEIDAEDEVTTVNFAFDFSVRHFINEGFHVNSQAMFWRREVHERFGEFDVRLHRAMDYDLILRLGLTEGNKAFLRVPYPLACFRRHPQQKTIGFDPVLAQEHRRIADKNKLPLKFSRVGKVLWLFYRFRRAYWYLKRGGLGYLLRQVAVSCMARSRGSQ